MSAATLKNLVESQAQVVPLTVEQYHRMIRTGIIPEGEPIELLDGFLVNKDRAKAGNDPITVGPEHAAMIRKLKRLTGKIEGMGCLLFQQLPITLPPYGEPEPDSAIVRGHEERYDSRHPTGSEVSCVIEVADSSIVRDRTTKKMMYGEGWIPQYLIINLVEDQLEEYRFSGGGKGSYRKARVLVRGDKLELIVGDARLAVGVDMLLP